MTSVSEERKVLMYWSMNSRWYMVSGIVNPIDGET